MNQRIDHRTARVNWQLGLALMPTHLYAQEASIREEVYARATLQAAPAWGVAHIKWNEDLLAHGTLELTELVVILPSGMFLNVPGNAIVSKLNLTTSQLSYAPVYLHFTGETQSVWLDDTADGEDDPVECLLQKLELSVSEQDPSDAQPALKLGEFAYEAGTWSLAQQYIPPSLSVALPFYEPSLRRSAFLCERFAQAVRDELEINYLAAESHSADTLANGALWRLRGAIADISAGAHTHPFDFYRELRQFYLHVCLFRKVGPTSAARPYRHRNIAEDLEVLLGELETQLSLPLPPALYRELLTNREGVRTCRVPDEIKSTADVFLLVQKPRAATEFDIGELKFASAERLKTVHGRALAGLVFEKLPGPPFYHGLSAAVEFFRPSAGAEWDYVIKARSLAVLDNQRLEGCRLFLYTRNPANELA